jgi:DNA-directed RNA polymerase subunit RPC12/RpoP
MENVRQALEDLLTTLSTLPQRTHCPRCHSRLLKTITTFFFYDGEKNWTVPLFSCPNCDSRREERRRP